MYGKQWLLDRDKQYADAVARRFNPEGYTPKSTLETNIRGFGEMLAGVPLKEKPFQSDGMTTVIHKDGQQTTRPLTAKEQRLEDRIERGVDIGLKTANVATRYGIPALGLTAAGVGLNSLTQQFEATTNDMQQTNATLMPN